MPPASRFGASKFRNAVHFVPGRDEWYRTQLPAASSSSSTSSSTSTFSSEVKSTRRWIVTATPAGDVSWRSYDSASAGGENVGSAKLGKGAIGDWDVSKLDDETLVLGCTDGTVHVYRLPSTSSDQPEALYSFNVGSAITTVSLHPTTPSVLLVSATQAPLAVYDLSSPSAPSKPAITLQVDAEPKGLWSCGWSTDGRKIGAFGKSGKAYVFDQPRQASTPATSKTISSIQPLKPVRVVWVDDKLFITGTDRSRNRLYALLSSTDLSTIFTQNVDTNLAPLVSVVDQERKIIYLSGRGDMSVRQVELGGVTGFQETVHPLPHPLASTSIAAAHPTILEVMQAEIGRLLLPVVDKDGDTILPLSIKVPRRQLIDYHDDLYPEISSTHPEQTAQEWLAGGDGAPLPLSLDPARRAEWETKDKGTTKGAKHEVGKQVESDAALPKPAASGISDTTAQTENQPSAQLQNGGSTTSKDDASTSNTPVQSETAAAAAAQATEREGGSNSVKATPAPEDPAKRDDASPAASSTQPATAAAKGGSAATAPSAPTPSPLQKGERYNPGWSRKFLAGKSPLNPTYDSLPPLSSLHQDSLIFKITPQLAFFPVQGPGGRLGVHPLKKKGRMVTGGEGYLSGGVEIADFDVEPFTPSAEEPEGAVRVAIAGEDGVICVWSVGPDGVNGSGPAPGQVLKSPGIDKIAMVAFHPTTKDLLTVLSNDGGSASIRLFDLSSGEEVKKVQLDLDGAFNMIWSPRGDRVAISSKDSRILVLDPRQPERVAMGAAHDSPRSIQIAWIDDTHLVSVGFSKGSQRRINLYAITHSSSSSPAIETVSSTLIDISPSVLFPVYDPDTSVLFIWGKGERQIMAYEVHPEHEAQESMSKLPSWTAASGSPQLGIAFFPKRTVDVKKVEIAKSLRLTAKSIEEVSFTIPRNKPEFFQDDIYVETLVVEIPVHASVQDWLACDVDSEGSRTYISLRPEGMTPLSQAPKTNTAAKKKFVPAANVMSEQEKKRKEMDDLFRKAKLDESSDEDDEPKRTGLDPPDDDW